LGIPTALFPEEYNSIKMRQTQVSLRNSSGPSGKLNSGTQTQLSFRRGTAEERHYIHDDNLPLYVRVVFFQNFIVVPPRFKQSFNMQT